MIEALAADSTHLYWMDSVGQVGNLRRVSKHGGTIETLATDLGFPGGLVVSDGYVYWGTSNANVHGRLAMPAVFRAMADGSAREVFADAPESVSQLSLANDVLYWDQTDADGSVALFGKALGSSAAPVPLAPDGGGFGFTAVGDCLFYVTASSGDGSGLRQQCSGGASVWRYNTSRRISLSPNASADEMYLYFGSDPGLMRISLSETGGPTLVTAGQGVRDVTVDGDEIYYVEGENGPYSCAKDWSISRVAATSGATPVSVVPAPLDCPASIIADDVAIYYRTSLSVFLVAK